MRKSACVFLLIISCSYFSAPRTANSAQSKAATSQAPRTSALFKFHSNFWVNLHQILFHEALLHAGKPDRRLQSNTPLAAPQMTEQEKNSWSAAIDFYSKEFQGQQELFNDELVKINDALAQQADDGESLHAPKLPQNVIAVLQRAAPIYRKYWWPAHDESNKNWIASERGRVQNLGPKLAAAMTKDLRQQWPAAPIRVDVCYYVPEIGHAYTTIPPHTMLSSSTPSLQGLDGFEVLFHEASHTFADTMTDALSAECRAQKKDCGDLWHAVLFYTSGVELRRLLPTAEQASFTPYAYKYGVYTRGNWPKYRTVLEADWQKYLDREITFADAICSMVADLQ
jgi:hypothetical protein